MIDAADFDDYDYDAWDDTASRYHLQRRKHRVCFSSLGSLCSQPCTSMSYIVHTVMIIMMNIESRSDG